MPESSNTSFNKPPKKVVSQIKSTTKSVTTKTAITKTSAQKKDERDNQDLADATEGKLKKLLNILQIEAQIKSCKTVKELEFLLVNNLKLMGFDYKQAIVYTSSYLGSKKIKATTASGVTHVDEQSSFLQWSEQIIKDLNLPSRHSTQIITLDMLSEELQSEWKEYGIFKLIWIPLTVHNLAPRQFLWLSISKTFADSQLTLLNKITSSFAYAFKFLEQKKVNYFINAKIYNRVTWLALLFVILIGFVPVRLSTLAPAEVVAKDATMISSPLNGIIERILPEANSVVTLNQPLIKIDDSQLSNELEVSKKNLDVKLAEYQTALQGAFSSMESKSQLTFLKQEVALAKAELDYNQMMLEETIIKAPHSGVILFDDPQNLIGKPIQIGQEIMELANPNSIELKIKIPLADAMILKEGYPIKFFLDSDPLHPIKGKINYSSYYAYPTPAKDLAYHVIAELDITNTPPRIGLSGTCKIFGDKVPLAYYLFRKPIATIRTKTGL